jgi:hypothetical protein
MSPTVGEKCSICQRIHVVKSMEILESLTPRQKVQTFKAEKEHRLFITGYCASLEMDNQIWEFYKPLAVWKISLEREDKEKKEELYCRLCGKSISEEEYREHEGYHRDCFYLEEFADADDYED